jgi:hypothetical protein
MQIAVAIFGILVILLVAQDAFETVVLPRRVTRRFRIARSFFAVTWSAWKALGRTSRRGSRRESYLSYFGPFSLLALFTFWAVLFVLGFAMLDWGLSLPIDSPNNSSAFLTYLYFSGTTFFTLGLGDISPMPGAGRALTVIEVGAGFAFLALVISYVPVIYQAFSRRELRISLLDARAGSPATAAELLRRNCAGKTSEELRILLRDWEAWCADILESHLSYPVLAYYRSQHDEQSWLGALTVILDTCAVIMTGIESIPASHARFAFAIARHTVVDLAQIFGASPKTEANRLSSDDHEHLCEILSSSGVHLDDSEAGKQRLADLRATYEPFVITLAEYMLLSVPPWICPENSLDDWQTTAWDDLMPGTRRTLLMVMHKESMMRPGSSGSQDTVSAREEELVLSDTETP